MSELPIIERGGKKYYFDARLAQLRNVNNPHDFIDLSAEENVKKKREHYVNLYRLVHDGNEGLWSKDIAAMSEEELYRQIVSLSAKAREMGRTV